MNKIILVSGYLCVCGTKKKEVSSTRRMKKSNQLSTLTLLRGLQRRRESLVVLLHVVVVEEHAERDVGFRGIAHPPYVLDQLSQLAIQPLLARVL